MTWAALQDRSDYTYKDYRAFPEEVRCEIIDGRVFDMTPSPSVKHQTVVLEIGSLLRTWTMDNRIPCRVFVAPTDVIFADDQIVQPDVLVVCDPSKIRDMGIFGSPDAVFEVLSPSTEIKDRREKVALYERYAVPELFLVHPEREFVEKYALKNHVYGRPALF